MSKVRLWSCVYSFSTRPILFRTERRGICLSYQVTDLDATRLDAKWHLPILTCSFVLISVKPSSLMGEFLIFLYSHLSSFGKVCLVLLDSVTTFNDHARLDSKKDVFNPNLKALESATAKVKWTRPR